MIETAKKNLLKSGRKNILFKVMDNLKMDTPDNYFDVVTARHTIINPVQIYKTLKDNGKLILLMTAGPADKWLREVFNEKSI